MRPNGTAGYIVPTTRDIPKLQSVYGDLPEGIPLLCYEDESWYLKFDLAPTQALFDVPQGTGKMVSIPLEYSIASTHSQSGSGDVIVDFDLGDAITVSLTGPSYIILRNLKKGKLYILNIKANNHAILNGYSLCKYPANMAAADWVKNRPTNVLGLIYINDIYAVSNVGTVEYRTEYKADTTSPEVALDTTLVDTLSNAVLLNSNISTVSFDNAFRFLVGNHAVYLADLPTYVYTVSFYMALYTGSDDGTIVGVADDETGMFWIYCESDYLKAKVYTTEGTSTLVASISDWILDELHQVQLIRTHDFVHLFVDGTLVDSEPILGDNEDVSELNLCVGYLDDAASLGAVANTSFPGYISHLEIASSVDNAYQYKPVARPTGVQPCAFLGRYSDLDLEDKGTGLANIVQSSVPNSGNPLFDYDVDLTYDMLGAAHSLVYEGSELVSVTDNFTIEAIIYNPSGNTRASIISHYKSVSEVNWHLGIYDGKLRLSIENSTYEAETSVVIPYDVTVVVAVVISGPDVTMYLDGEVVLEHTFASAPDYMTYTTGTYLGVGIGPGQNNALAVLNTSLYPSKSLISIRNVAVIDEIAYVGTSSTSVNYLVPNVLGGREVWA